MIEEFDERCRETLAALSAMGVRTPRRLCTAIRHCPPPHFQGEHAEDRPELRGTTGGGGSDGAIVAGVVAMAHALGMDVVVREWNRRAAAQGDGS